MTCNFCGSRNGDDDRRCRRCGRTPGDTRDFHRTHGALAAQPQPEPEPSRTVLGGRPLSIVPNLSRAVQGLLFPEKDGKVVPIESYAPVHPPLPKPRSGQHSKPHKPSGRRAPSVPEGQGRLEFLPPQPPKPRALATTVEAVIYCEAPVGTPLHRAMAAVLDWLTVSIGYGLFLLTFRLFGGQFELNRTNLAVFASALPLLGLTYGLLFLGRETPGMRWMHLTLITFDGFRPDPKQRLIRFAGACLSVCTVVGLLWCLADEEGLTWPDHISGTFPTPSDGESKVFKRR